MRVSARLRFAHNNLLDLAVLSEILVPAQRLQQQTLILDRGVQANDVDEVLLDDSNTSKILATRGLDLALLCFFLLCCGSFAVFLREIGFEPVDKTC